MKKRNFICILVFLLLMSIATVCAFADGLKFTIEAPERTISVGETFTVTVKVSGNPGLCVVQYGLKFNKSKVAIREVAVSDKIGGNPPKMTYVTNNVEGQSKIAAISITPMTGDGVLVTYTFEALRKLTSFDFDLVDGVFGDDKTKYTYTVVKPTYSAPADPDDEEPEETNGTGKGADPVTAAAITFTDVPEDHWAAAFIAEASQKGLFGGYPDGTFRPGAYITRGQFIAVLWRMEGSPEAANTTPFTDVAADAYYADAIAWAYSKGYINGVTETLFMPDAPISRQALVSILFKYSGQAAGAELLFYSAYDEAYKDSASIAAFAKPAMYWAVYSSIISGVTTDTLVPTGYASRAQVAKILVNFAKTSD